jgi:hypothetical protein
MVAVTACHSDGDSDGVRERDVDDFVQKAGLVLPTSAVPTDYRWVFSMDGMMLLRVEMPSGDLPAFLADSGLSKESIRPTDPAANEAIFGEFLAKNPVKFRAGQKQLGDGFALNFLIDDDSEETKVVYLMWFGT